MDTVDTLILILERIDSPVTLIRAASTCRRWRRIIADASFLRRCRSIQGPLVAGDYFNCNRSRDATTGSPSFVPSSSIIDARHFSLDFVVDASIFEPWSSLDINPSWKVCGSRGSLLLMECVPEPFMSGPFPNLIVCEPLTRSYEIIPRPPGSNTDFVLRRIYLVDGDEDEAGGRIGMSNFRVQCMLLSCEDGVTYTTVLTVGRGDNSAWSEKVVDHIALRLVNPNAIPCYLGCALGSSYSYVQEDGMLISHDGSTGKFSWFLLSLDIKSYWDGQNFTQNSYAVDGGDGEPRIVTVTTNRTLEVFAMVDGRWGLENKVVLSKVTHGLPGYWASFFDRPLTIIKRGVGFVVISSSEPKPQWAFSVDLKTMEVATTAAECSRERMAYPCEFPWPPVLQVCLDR